MHIAILLFPGVQMLDVVGPMDVFSEAARQSGNAGAYRVSLIGFGNCAISASNGIRIVPDLSGIDDLGEIDTLLVPGLQNRSAFAAAEVPLQWLTKQAVCVRRLGSICSGATVLAAAGLLDGKRITTHWDTSGQLAARYPHIHVEPDKPYIKDGRIYTSAGVTAGMDLALQMVEEDFGKSVAMRVARELIIFPHRLGGQLQFSGRSCAPQASRHDDIRQVQEWVRQNLDKPLTVEQLALQAGMSLRNFLAKFQEETSLTPTEFIESCRTTEASRLLKNSSYSIAKICAICGFPEATEFRSVFRKHFGTTPFAYRKRHAAAAIPSALVHDSSQDENLS